jgi:hypothetical protein
MPSVRRITVSLAPGLSLAKFVTLISPIRARGAHLLILVGASEFSDKKVYEILEGAKSAKGFTSGINFVSLDRLRVIPNMN